VTTTNEAMGALFALLCGAAQWRTTSRKRQALSAIKAGDQPMMFLTCEKEHYAQRTTGMPDKISVEAECWVFCRTDGDLWRDGDPSPVEALVEAVKAALLPDCFSQRQTLGLAIQEARIEGDLDKWPGENGQAAACIPIRILLPT
jgi:hypothetical protein